jgi:hypothetical protein
LAFKNDGEVERNCKKGKIINKQHPQSFPLLIIARTVRQRWWKRKMEITIINIFYVSSLLRLASASIDIVSTTMANVKAIKSDFWLILGFFLRREFSI